VSEALAGIAEDAMMSARAEESVTWNRGRQLVAPSPGCTAVKWFRQREVTEGTYPLALLPPRCLWQVIMTLRQ